MKENKWLFNGEFEGMKGIILESRGGAKKSNAQRNPDYKLLLQYTLETLKMNQSKEVEIYIASKRDTKYPNLSDRLLAIDQQSKFDFTKVEIDAFITKLSKQIRLAGQSGTEKGGNSTKRLFFRHNSLQMECIPTMNIVKDENPTSTKDDKQLVKNTLDRFKFEFQRNKKSKQSEIKKQVSVLQNCLKEHLEKSLQNYQWQTEFKVNKERKDSFDIYGYNKQQNSHIVVELDPHRADSIAKKFVSRLALMVDKNLLYVAFLYPGTDKMPINEANKYLGDCETILEVINGNSDLQKQFLGFFLD